MVERFGEIPEEPTRLDDRLDELAALKAGWLDGEGVRPDGVVLDRARSTLGDVLGFEVPRARVFATLEGGVQAEWTVDGREISVTFQPDGTLYAVSVDPLTGATDESRLAADDPAERGRD